MNLNSWIVVGGTLSVVLALLILFLLRDARNWAEPDLPWRLGPVRVPPQWASWGWRTVLVLSFLASLYGLPLTTRTERFSRTEPEIANQSPVTRTTRTIRLPFYVRTTRADRAADGTALVWSVTEKLQLPWPALLAVILYGVAWQRATLNEEKELDHG